MHKESKPKLRVLFAGVSWPLETFNARLIRGLADAGLEVTVASETQPSRNQFLDNPGIRWIHTPSWKVGAAARLFRFGWLSTTAFLRSNRDARRFNFYARQNPERSSRFQTLYQLLPFAGRKWDVIYFPWNSGAINHLPLFDIDCPVVISCRGSQINIVPHVPSRTGFADYLRATFALATVVHCVSEAIKCEAGKYGLDKAKARVIRPAVDLEFFYPSESPCLAQRQFRVVTTGNLAWVKGHEFALMSMRELLDQGIDIHYDIIGAGSERQRIDYTIRDLELESHVRLHGGLDQERVRNILQQADAFLLSSLSEGISNAVLEAMACGLPVVTTACGGMLEAITDGVEGFVVPVRDTKAMAAKLAELAASPELRNRMGRAARKRVEASFSLSNQINDFCQLYQTAKESRH